MKFSQTDAPLHVRWSNNSVFLSLQGWRPSVWDASPHPQPISRHSVGWPFTPHSILWSSPQWVLLWPASELLWGHYILLPEWRQAAETGQRAARHLLRRDSVLWTGRVSHHKIQVIIEQFFSIKRCRWNRQMQVVSFEKMWDAPTFLSFWGSAVPGTNK